jgi:DNA-binding transcriptional LysR family regulator
LRDEPRGRLRIATSVAFASLFLAPMLPAFRDRYPGIDIDLLASDEVIDLPEAGADIAIRFGEMRRPGLVARRLAPIRLGLFATPAFLARVGTPTDGETLAAMAAHCLGGGPGQQSGWQLRKGDRRVRLTPGEGIRANNGTVYRALILGGAGIGMMNRIGLAPQLASGEVVELLEDWQIEGAERQATWIVLPHNRAIPPKVRVLIDWLVAELGEPGASREAPAIAP